MNINWLESIIYGFVSGLSEFFPISSNGHQHIMLYLLGADGRDPVRDFFVHIGLLLCVFTCSRTLLEIIRRDRSYTTKNRGSYHYQSKIRLDASFVRSASIPMILGMILLNFLVKTKASLIITSVLLLVNGLLIFLPDRMMQGNKDASVMSPFDSLLIGAAGALSILSGFSRFGFTYSASIARGAAKNHAFTWSLLLSIPAIICLIVFDVFAMFTLPTAPFWSNLIGYILSGIASFGGTFLSISAVRSITSRSGLSGFAYYCWGAALLSFFIFLTVA